MYKVTIEKVDYIIIVFVVSQITIYENIVPVAFVPMAQKKTLMHTKRNKPEQKKDSGTQVSCELVPTLDVYHYLDFVDEYLLRVPLMWCWYVLYQRSLKMPTSLSNAACPCCLLSYGHPLSPTIVITHSCILSISTSAEFPNAHMHTSVTSTQSSFPPTHTVAKL